MILWQKIEGALVFAAGLSLVYFAQTDLPLWLAFLAFFAPDFSFVGYVLGPKIGGICYNCVHIYGFGAVLFALGTALSAPTLAALGALWLAHSGFDRMLGYGLKSSQGFHTTHLGEIGPRTPHGGKPRH